MDNLFGQPDLSHDHLQQLAIRLLKGKNRRLRLYDLEATEQNYYLGSVGGCAVVASEIPGHSEIPDAIGWSTAGYSTLVECKASRSDFLRDQKKYFRRVSEMGVGMQRFYLTPPGLLSPEELPEGWGLLEAGHPLHLTKIRMVRASERFEISETSEMSILIQLMRIGGTMVDHRIGAYTAFIRPWGEDSRVPEPVEHREES